MRGSVIGGWIAVALFVATPAQAADFSARNPEQFRTVMGDRGAEGELKVTLDGKLSIEAYAGKKYFEVSFGDCDRRRTTCGLEYFYAWWPTKALTADQINRWNRWTLRCPAYLDKGEPTIWNGSRLLEGETREEVADVVDNWLGCLDDFNAFVAHPEAFLSQKEAPPG